MGMVMAAIAATATGIFFLTVVDVELERDAAVRAIHLTVLDDILGEADRFMAIRARYLIITGVLIVLVILIISIKIIFQRAQVLVNRVELVCHIAIAILQIRQGHRQIVQ